MMIGKYKVTDFEENGRLVISYAPISGSGGGRFSTIIDEYMRGVLKDPRRRDEYVRLCVAHLAPKQVS